MELKLKDIAQMVGGRLEGNPEEVISGAAGLTEARKGDISFLGNPKYQPLLQETRAGCVFLPEDLKADGYLGNRIHVKNPQWAFAQVLTVWEKERRQHPKGIHSTAVVHSSAKLGREVVIGAHTVVEEGVRIGDRSVLYAHCYVGANSQIGSDCLIYPRVVVREECLLGDRVIIQPGVVIGGDGYGFVMIEGSHRKIPQLGRVVVEDDVEIGANTTIDRATTGETRIGKGTKIDNLVQIAHNVKIGRHCLVISQVAIAGSTQIGNYVTLAGQVAIAGHLKIGDKAVIAGQSGVMSDLEPGTVVFGSPARPHREAMKIQAILGKLPEIYQTIKEMKKK